MFCKYCGNSITNSAKFCTSCGKEIISPSFNVKIHHPIAVPVWIYPVVVVAILVSIVFTTTIFFNRGHDLRGKYYTNEFFPISTIVFNRNGTFTAESDLSYNEGRYFKYGNKYRLVFVDGKSILDKANRVLYELEVIKNDNGTLTFTVIPQYSYWAWIGTSVIFYPL